MCSSARTSCNTVNIQCSWSNICTGKVEVSSTHCAHKSVQSILAKLKYHQHTLLMEQCLHWETWDQHDSVYGTVSALAKLRYQQNVAILICTELRYQHHSASGALIQQRYKFTMLVLYHISTVKLKDLKHIIL